jgi:hypothetical protein
MIRKRFPLLCLTALLTLLLCTAAHAERKKFEHFSMDIPAGWTATEDTDAKGQKTVIVTNPAKGLTVMVGIEKLEGKSVKDKCEEFAKQVGSSVEEMGSDTFGVTFTGADGKNSLMVMAPLDAEHGFGFAITGFENELDPDIEAMMNSIED